MKNNRKITTIACLSLPRKLYPTPLHLYLYPQHFTQTSKFTLYIKKLPFHFSPPQNPSCGSSCSSTSTGSTLFLEKMFFCFCFQQTVSLNSSVCYSKTQTKNWVFIWSKQISSYKVCCISQSLLGLIVLR